MSRPLFWRDVPALWRTLAWWTAVVQMVGYTTALVFVRHTTRMSTSGITARYRGLDPDVAAGAMQFPKSFAEMLNITHTHLLGMAMIFVLTGLGVVLCEWPSERWRRLLIAEPFLALLVSFSAMWLVRYVAAPFSALLFASSAIMALTFYVQTFLILRELHHARGLVTDGAQRCTRAAPGASP